MKRIVAILLALVMLISCVVMTGCSGKKYQPLISYGEKSISVNMFSYILSSAKTMALYSLGQTSDVAEVWDTDSGKAMADYIMADAVSTSMSLIYYASVAEKNGQTLSDTEEKEIEDSLSALMQNYNVNKSGFNDIMAQYGVNYDILKEYYSLQRLAQKGMDYVLGENGTHPITDEDYHEYYNENYATLRHLYLNNINKIGANGKETILTAEEKAAVENQASQIEAALMAGQDLSEFGALSADGLLEAYPEGITIPIQSNLLYAMSYAAEEEGTFNVFGLYYYLLNNIDGFAQTTLTGTEGEIKRIDSDKGIFILEKMPLNQDMFELYKDVMIEDGSLKPQKTKELMESLKDEFTIDNATLETFSVKGAGVIMG